MSLDIKTHTVPHLKDPNTSSNIYDWNGLGSTFPEPNQPNIEQMGLQTLKSVFALTYLVTKIIKSDLWDKCYFDQYYSEH